MFILDISFQNKLVITLFVFGRSTGPGASLVSLSGVFWFLLGISKRSMFCLHILHFTCIQVYLGVHSGVSVYS